ncbi:UDP-N-acetylmuramoyl-L-alanyl-D-glutamate--2,6-diaminopimelate ligase [Paraconexibacter sp. AEG42_29]|uniref:UDP-N-acetylmuramoyl-L-alanyl-D-glutamate--2,6-diaminopimelate ligase n=1 Tax=Paraconexibacter sp. AEG42_29 TaxID=2997339 RepID=A0AAU7AUN0_9ACTN
MRLGAILPVAGPRDADVEIGALAYDNRAVNAGTLFFCVPGFTRDGHDFAPDAVARGAAALVVSRRLDGPGLDGVPQVLVPDVRTAMATAAAAFHGDPTATLQTVGITGTNGKTTSAYMVRSLLEAAGRQTGLLGTVASVVGGVEQPAVRTTPEAIDLQATFAAMRAAGDQACVMEVSSHALELRRADAIHWAGAIFTNLTQDHLDFHPGMEEYFQAKRLLFAAADHRRAPLVFNIDDAYGERLDEEFPHATTIAIDHPAADLRATDVTFGLTSSTFTLDGQVLSVPLPGRFNVLNALGAIAIARQLGVDDATVAAALPSAQKAPGRMQSVERGQDFAVLVDYAHTPDSLQNVLRAARALVEAGPADPGRVLVVFGAGGDRDRGKRPQMGAIAASEADLVYVTSDNPRSEAPGAILAEIVAGMGGRGPGRPGVEVLEDRRAAIAAAVGAAQAGDVVLIAGKGHEQGQEFADGVKLPFDDVTEAEASLDARLVA